MRWPLHGTFSGTGGGITRHSQGRGAYVPLDPAYPKERLAFMLSDTQVPVLVTQQKIVTDLLSIRHVWCAWIQTGSILLHRARETLLAG